ncbi:hypothetical protein ACOMHN_011951 [Nucella lapillus]
MYHFGHCSGDMMDVFIDECDEESFVSAEGSGMAETEGGGCSDGRASSLTDVTDIGHQMTGILDRDSPVLEPVGCDPGGTHTPQKIQDTDAGLGCDRVWTTRPRETSQQTTGVAPCEAAPLSPLSSSARQPEGASSQLQTYPHNVWPPAGNKDQQSVGKDVWGPLGTGLSEATRVHWSTSDALVGMKRNSKSSDSGYYATVGGGSGSGGGGTPLFPDTTVGNCRAFSGQILDPVGNTATGSGPGVSDHTSSGVFHTSEREISYEGPHHLVDPKEQNVSGEERPIQTPAKFQRSFETPQVERFQQTMTQTSENSLRQLQGHPDSPMQRSMGKSSAQPQCSLLDPASEQRPSLLQISQESASCLQTPLIPSQEQRSGQPSSQFMGRSSDALASLLKTSGSIPALKPGSLSAAAREPVPGVDPHSSLSSLGSGTSWLVDQKLAISETHAVRSDWTLRERDLKAGAEGSRVDSTRVEGSKVEGSKVEGTGVEDTKIGGSRVEGSKAEGSKVDGTSAEDPRFEGSRVESTRLEGSRVEGIRVEGLQKPTETKEMSASIAQAEVVASTEPCPTAEATTALPEDLGLVPPEKQKSDPPATGWPESHQYWQCGGNLSRNSSGQSSGDKPKTSATASSVNPQRSSMESCAGPNITRQVKSYPGPNATAQVQLDPKHDLLGSLPTASSVKSCAGPNTAAQPQVKHDPKHDVLDSQPTAPSMKPRMSGVKSYAGPHTVAQVKRNLPDSQSNVNPRRPHIIQKTSSDVNPTPSDFGCRISRHGEKTPDTSSDETSQKISEVGRRDTREAVSPAAAYDSNATPGISQKIPEVCGREARGRSSPAVGEYDSRATPEVSLKTSSVHLKPAPVGQKTPGVSLHMGPQQPPVLDQGEDSTMLGTGSAPHTASKEHELSTGSAPYQASHFPENPPNSAPCPASNDLALPQGDALHLASNDLSSATERASNDLEFPLNIPPDLDRNYLDLPLSSAPDRASDDLDHPMNKAPDLASNDLALPMGIAPGRASNELDLDLPTSSASCQASRFTEHAMMKSTRELSRSSAHHERSMNSGAAESPSSKSGGPDGSASNASIGDSVTSAGNRHALREAHESPMGSGQFQEGRDGNNDDYGGALERSQRLTGGSGGGGGSGDGARGRRPNYQVQRSVSSVVSSGALPSALPRSMSFLGSPPLLSAQAQTWTEMDVDSEVFIRTAVMDEAQEVLEESSLVVLTGPPRCGKTILGRALLRSADHNRWTCCTITCVSEWRKWVGGGQRVMVFLDEVFGHWKMNLTEVEAWKSALEGMEKWRREGGVKLIFTLTPTVLRSLRKMLPGCDVFSSLHEVRVGWLSDEEKCCMLDSILLHKVDKATVTRLLGEGRRSQLWGEEKAGSRAPLLQEESLEGQDWGERQEDGDRSDWGGQRQGNGQVLRSMEHQDWSDLQEGSHRDWEKLLKMLKRWVLKNDQTGALFPTGCLWLAATLSRYDGSHVEEYLESALKIFSRPSPLYKEVALQLLQDKDTDRERAKAVLCLSLAGLDVTDCNNADAVTSRRQSLGFSCACSLVALQDCLQTMQGSLIEEGGSRFIHTHAYCGTALALGQDFLSLVVKVVDWSFLVKKCSVPVKDASHSDLHDNLKPFRLEIRRLTPDRKSQSPEYQALVRRLAEGLADPDTMLLAVQHPVLETRDFVKDLKTLYTKQGQDEVKVVFSQTFDSTHNMSLLYWSLFNSNPFLFEWIFKTVIGELRASFRKEELVKAAYACCMLKNKALFLEKLLKYWKKTTSENVDVLLTGQHLTSQAPPLRLPVPKSDSCLVSCWSDQKKLIKNASESSTSLHRGAEDSGRESRARKAKPLSALGETSGKQTPGSRRPGATLSSPPLLLAVEFNNEDVVDLILGHYRHTAVVRDSRGRSALHVAVHCGHLDMVSRLAEHPQLLRLKDEKSSTALDVALLQGRLEMRELLRGAECDQTPVHD